MRRIYQIDGIDSGVVSVGERDSENQVALCVQSDDKEVHVLLDHAAFMELCRLQYTVHFVLDEKETEEQRLQAV